MPKMRDLTAVDADYATSGPNQNTIVQAIAVPASTLFNCLADGPAWKEWLGLDAAWTSPEPHGVGTTRTAKIGGQTIEETFLTCERMSREPERWDYFLAGAPVELDPVLKRLEAEGVVTDIVYSVMGL